MQNVAERRASVVESLSGARAGLRDSSNRLAMVLEGVVGPSPAKDGGTPIPEGYSLGDLSADVRALAQGISDRVAELEQALGTQTTAVAVNQRGR